MELIVRAVDVGSGNTKFVAAAVGSDIRCTSFPSVAYLYAIGAYNQNVVGSKADFGTAKRGEQAGEQSKTEHKKSNVHEAFRELFNLHQHPLPSPPSGGGDYSVRCARSNNNNAVQRRMLDCEAISSRLTCAVGFQLFLRCSATTLVNIPPRTKKRAVRRMNRGCVALIRSSRMRLVTSSWKCPSLRKPQI